MCLALVLHLDLVGLGSLLCRSICCGGGGGGLWCVSWCPHVPGQQVPGVGVIHRGDVIERTHSPTQGDQDCVVWKGFLFKNAEA